MLTWQFCIFAPCAQQMYPSSSDVLMKTAKDHGSSLSNSSSPILRDSLYFVVGLMSLGMVVRLAMRAYHGGGDLGSWRHGAVGRGEPPTLLLFTPQSLQWGRAHLSAEGEDCRTVYMDRVFANGALAGNSAARS